MKFKNPIIPGFYPDPSICRVNDDYYLVSSSFEYFPAIPVWHSKDLVNWKQITNAINSKEQSLGLDVNFSGGVQACTIRHYKDTFYITSTNVGKSWPSLNYNFIITAKDPKGPWSKVHYLKDAPGIDSSLFFDDDGKCYFHANRQVEGMNPSDAEIWIQELNLETFELIGEKHTLWNGCGGVYPESPHIIKRNGIYYLFIAEGGTGFEHTTTLASSKNIFGPYKSSVRNPILTHKHLSPLNPITCVGHSDIVQTQNGDWYLVCLGTRPKQLKTENEFSVKTYSPLGRETFLTPIVWYDDETFSIATKSACIEEILDFPNLDEVKQDKDSGLVMFDSTLPIYFRTVKREDFNFMKIENNLLKLYSSTSDLGDDATNKSILLRSIISHNNIIETAINTFLNDKEKAGLTVYYTHNGYLSYHLVNENNKIFLCLEKRLFDKVILLNKVEVTSSIKLKIINNDHYYNFYYKMKDEWILFEKEVEGLFLSPTCLGGHTGVFIGYFATGKNTQKILLESSYFLYQDI